jgi:hypothetical protein
MTYTLSQAANSMAIAEYEYATGAAIQFTAFNSCAGVVAKVAGGGQVVGVHLVAVTNDPAGGDFSAADGATVMATLLNLNYDPASVTIIGQWNCFTMEALAAIGPATFEPAEQGTFGATLGNGGIVLNVVAAAPILAPAPAAAPAPAPAAAAANAAPNVPNDLPPNPQDAQEQIAAVEAADAQMAAQAAQALAGAAVAGAAVAGAATGESQLSATSAQSGAEAADFEAANNSTGYQ